MAVETVTEPMSHEHSLRNQRIDGTPQLFAAFVVALECQPPGDALERVARAGMQCAVATDFIGQVWSGLHVSPCVRDKLTTGSKSRASTNRSCGGPGHVVRVGSDPDAGAGGSLATHPA